LAVRNAVHCEVEELFTFEVRRDTAA